MKEYSNNELIKNSQLSQEDINLLREKFISEYSKTKGWNPNDLSTNQMLEITSQNRYKQPGLLLG
jgi:Ca2+-binding EF-hand superfamily protein